MNNQKMDERTKKIVDDVAEAAKKFILLPNSEKEFILGFIKGMVAQKELSEAREKIAQGGRLNNESSRKNENTHQQKFIRGKRNHYLLSKVVICEEEVEVQT